MRQTEDIPLKIISCLRPFIGFDEYPLYLELLKLDPTLINFDDRLFRYYFTNSYLQKIARKISHAKIRNDFNQMLISYLKSYKPDLFICFNTPLLSSDVFDYLPSGCRSIMLYPDLDPTVHGSDFMLALSKFDLLFHTKKNLKDKFSSINSNSVCINTLYSAINHKFVCEKAISTFHNPAIVAHYSENKLDLLNSFARDLDFQIDVYGSNWPKNKIQNINFNQSVFGPPVIDIYRDSLFTIGLLQDKLTKNGVGDVLTSRSYLVPLSGGLLVHQDNNYARQLYGSKFELFFENSHDLNRAFEVLQDPNYRREQMRFQLDSVLANSVSVQSFVEDYVL